MLSSFPEVTLDGPEFVLEAVFESANGGETGGDETGFEIGSLATLAVSADAPTLGMTSAGNLSRACLQRSLKDAPPTTFSTGMSTFSSFKNHDRTSTATSESRPSSTRGAS